MIISLVLVGARRQVGDVGLVETLVRLLHVLLSSYAIALTAGRCPPLSGAVPSSRRRRVPCGCQGGELHGAGLTMPARSRPSGSATERGQPPCRRSTRRSTPTNA